MRPVPMNQWDESLDHVVSDMDGRPLNIHALLANHPPLLDAWWTLRNYLIRGGNLRQRDCELAILRVASRMNSWYEWASHVVRGLDAGVTLEEIKRVRSDDGTWDKRDAALLEAVDEILRDHRLSAETLKRLGAFFTDPQVLDLVQLQGMYTTLACTIATWDLELDAHVAARLPDSVTREEFDAG